MPVLSFQVPLFEGGLVFAFSDLLSLNCLFNTLLLYNCFPKLLSLDFHLWQQYSCPTFRGFRTFPSLGFEFFYHYSIQS